MPSYSSLFLFAVDITLHIVCPLSDKNTKKKTTHSLHQRIKTSLVLTEYQLQQRYLCCKKLAVVLQSLDLEEVLFMSIYSCSYCNEKLTMGRFDSCISCDDILYSHDVGCSDEHGQFHRELEREIMDYEQ